MKEAINSVFVLPNSAAHPRNSRPLTNTLSSVFYGRNYHWILYFAYSYTYWRTLWVSQLWPAWEWG